jgi:hypothetical protein
MGSGRVVVAAFGRDRPVPDQAVVTAPGGLTPAFLAMISDAVAVDPIVMTLGPRHEHFHKV